MPLDAPGLHGDDPRPLIVGAITLNTGDAAIAQGVATFLQNVSPRWQQPVVVDRDPDDAAKNAPDLAFGARWWRGTAPQIRWDSNSPHWRAARLMNRGRRRAVRTFYPRLRRPARLLETTNESTLLDLIHRAPVNAVTGGTNFVDHYAWEERLDDLDLLRRARRPYFFATQTMGPFLRASDGYAALARVLDGAELVMVRDQRTLDAVERLTTSSEAVIAPDMAFLADVGMMDPLGKAESTQHSTDRPLRIGLSVREWRHNSGSDPDTQVERFEIEMARFIELAVRDLGAEFTFVSTCQGVSSYIDDSKMAKRIALRVHDAARPSISIDDAHFTPTTLVRCWQQQDFVISTRMHGAILSWMAGVPALAIDYEHKARDLFDRHGLGEAVVDYSSLDARRLLAKTQAMLDDLSAWQERVARVVVQERRQLEELAHYVGSRIARSV